MQNTQLFCFADPYCANILPGALGRSTTITPAAHDYNGAAGPVTIAIPNAVCFVLLFWAVAGGIGLIGRRVRSLRRVGLLFVGGWGFLTTGFRLLGLVGRGEPRLNLSGVLTMMAFGVTGICMAAAIYLAYRWSVRVS